MVASALPAGVTTTSPELAKEVAIVVPPVWELLAVFVGALSGGLAAVEKRFDAAGLVVLAIVTGMGGGIVRDVLLQRYGIAALHDNRYLFTALVAAFAAFFFAGIGRRLAKPMLYIDALSLGLFAVVGADKALRAGMTILPAIMLGVVTAVGGGLLRDLLSHKETQILLPGGWYAAAAAVGSSTFVLLVMWLNVVKDVASVAAIAVVVLLRVASLWLGWQTPTPRDYSDAVAAWPRRVLSWTPFYPKPDDGPGGADEGVEEVPEDAPPDSG